MFYKTDKFDGEIKSSDEGKVYWIKLEKMKTMKLANDMQDMLKIFLNDELSEFYYYKENLFAALMPSVATKWQYLDYSKK